MAIDVERMKCGVEDLKKVLHQAQALRSWIYTEGESENKYGGSYSDDLCILNELIASFEKHDWDLKKYFLETATAGCEENTDLKLMNRYQEKVDEHLNRLEVY